MIINPNLKRLMIPRWRSLRLTLRSKELSSSFLKNDSAASQITPELQRRLENWRRSPNLVTAAELVETAIVDGQDEEAVDAARTLVATGSQAVPLVQTQAALLLKRVGLGSEIPEYIKLQAGASTALWRRRTRLHPENALAWVELALSYTVDGRLDRAERALSAALQLAPNNRYVLRSACRFFLHSRDDLRAYEVIAKSEAVQHDPWLIASEVALAEHIGTGPRFYKRGAAMLDGTMLPRQLTELAGAIATTELVGGNKKKARRYFTTSMLDPNANALAQAEWASPRFGDELFAVSKLHSVEEAYEARAHHLYREGQFSDVYIECEAWMDDEPYSIRPYELSAGTANILDEHEKADEVTRRGLKMRPNWPPLLNCRAYALASQNRLEDAHALLVNFPSGAPEWARFVSEANKGLIAFRRGKLVEGIAKYQGAIDNFQKAGFAPLALSAKTYLCREMVRSGLPEGEKMLEMLRQPVRNSNDKAIKKAFQTAEDFLAARKLVRQMELNLAGS
jgi:tetratricopeptide (TPR) repeat protein